MAIIPTWLKAVMKEMVPELLGEFIGVQSIKKIISKSKDQADEKTIAEASGEKERKGPEIKREGIFSTSDESSFLDLLGKVEVLHGKEEKKYALKISKLLNSFPEEWQRRRFRVVVGMLNIDYDVKEIAKEFSEKRFPNGKLEEKKEKTSEKSTVRNLGVQVLVSLAKCDEHEMLEICQASGILNSELDSIKKGWEKLTAWAEKQGPEIIDSINDANTRIKESAYYKKPRPRKIYPGFFRAFFGFGQKSPRNLVT